MGYTHYWKQKIDTPFTDEEWKKIVDATKEILTKAAHAGIVINGGDGTGEAAISDNAISLNGCGPDSHETFYLTRVPEQPEWREKEKETFSFCKTARKPYDRVVVSILAKAKEIAPDKIRISSDGGAEALIYQF